jgi:hypothetical protein
MLLGSLRHLTSLDLDFEWCACSQTIDQTHISSSSKAVCVTSTCATSPAWTSSGEGSLNRGSRAEAAGPVCWRPTSAATARQLVVSTFLGCQQLGVAIERHRCVASVRLSHCVDSYSGDPSVTSGPEPCSTSLLLS